MARPSITTGEGLRPLLASDLARRWLSRAARRRCSRALGLRAWLHQLIFPSCVARFVDVQRHDAHQLLVAHFGEHPLAVAFQQVAGEPGLGLDEGVDLLLDRAATDELVHEDIASLPDPEGSIGCLTLDRRIPPPVEMDHMRGGREIEARAAGLEGEHE